MGHKSYKMKFIYKLYVLFHSCKYFMVSSFNCWKHVLFYICLLFIQRCIDNICKMLITTININHGILICRFICLTTGKHMFLSHNEKHVSCSYQIKIQHHYHKKNPLLFATQLLRGLLNFSQSSNKKM